jgi:tRNA threonylcarbamoyladenosine biosynthesis protein TsaE
VSAAVPPFVSSSPEQTERFGEALGGLLRAGDVVLLAGDLGAGKTQLAKGVARALGVQEAVTSPTFNLVLEHETALGIPLRHFDLYRLTDASELADIDYFGLLEDAAISVVEWGDRFSDALPLDYLLINLKLQDDDARTLHLSATGPRAKQLISPLVIAELAAAIQGDTGGRDSKDTGGRNGR